MASDRFGHLKGLPSRSCTAVFLCFLIALMSFSRTRHSNVVWVWVGGVTTDSAVIKAKIEPDFNEAKLRVAPAIDFGEKSGREMDAEADSDGIVAFSISGLQPDREYEYLVQTDNGSGLTGRLHTFADGPMSFQVGFASCATTGSNHRIFSTLENLQLHLFIHMGDFHYEDIERNNPFLFRRAYDRVLTSPRQGGFYRSTPVAYVWDDHDFGSDDADGTSPSKKAALQTYQQCVPHYDLSPVNGEVGTIQQAFTVGRVRFLLLDVRAERVPANKPDGPDKTMLGKQQLQWLRRELKEARQRYPLVVLVNPVPWITKDNPGSGHGWAPYGHERAVIANMIKECDLADRLLMFSGDGHMAAIDDGTNSNYAGGEKSGETAFPVIQAAPLDRYPRIKGGPYSHGAIAPYSWLRIFKARQFGLMQLEDDGDLIEIELSCRNSDGEILKNLVLKVECNQAGCKTLE